MANPDRRGGGGLSLGTLAIASAASMTAALVTSRLFPPGTVYAAALTPVIVAAVTEMLHRPAERVNMLREQRRTMVLEARDLESAAVGGDEPDPLRGAPEFAQGADAPHEPVTNGAGASPPMRVYRSDRARRGWTGRVHPKVWIVTGLVAFVVAAGALTLPELIFGGAVASQDRTTFFGGGEGSEKRDEPNSESETTAEPAPTVTETVPAQTPPESTESEPAPTETGADPAPGDTGGTPAPSETGTETTPAPGGAVPAVP